MTTLTDLAPSARPAAGTRRSGSIPRRPQRRSYGRGFWVVGYVFAVAMAFSTIPAPLYVLYQARDHFGALLVTVIFAAYAVGVMASLFLAGHISDWLGRRRMVAAALGVNMLSGVVFLAWPSVPGLIVGRVISGVSIGMLGGALALAVTPETVARPRRRPRYHPQRVSVPAADRSAFFAAGLATVAAFALFGMFTSLAPGFIAETLGDGSHALAGLATFVVFGAAALAQIAVSRAATSRQFRIGLTVLILGLAMVTIAVWLPSLTLFLLGGALAGAGAGAAFKGSISTVIAIAPPRPPGGDTGRAVPRRLLRHRGTGPRPRRGHPVRQRPDRSARLRRGPGGCRGDGQQAPGPGRGVWPRPPSFLIPQYRNPHQATPAKVARCSLPDSPAQTSTTSSCGPGGTRSWPR